MCMNYVLVMGIRDYWISLIIRILKKDKNTERYYSVNISIKDQLVLYLRNRELKPNILVIKQIDENVEEDTIVKSTLQAVAILVGNQKTDHQIEGVSTDNNTLVNLVKIYVEEWMSMIKVSGTKKKVAEVFFSIVTKFGFGTLIKHQIQVLKHYKISLSIKNAEGKHIVKIGYTVGPNLEYANLQFYA